jgi:hypothetical protein
MAVSRYAFQHSVNPTKTRVGKNIVVLRSSVFAGLLPNDLTYVRGETCIRRGGERLVLPEESDAIALIGAGWIAPADRAEFALR